MIASLFNYSTEFSDFLVLAEKNQEKDVL